MINVQKYVDFKLPDNDFKKIFTPEICKKAEKYIEMASAGEKVDVEQELFLDPDFSVLMGFFLEKEYYSFFLQMENSYVFFLQQNEYLLNFDWKINEQLTFANYFFLKNYPVLYKHNIAESDLEITNAGYIMSLLTKYIKVPLLTGDLPLTPQMRKNFLITLG